MSTLQLCSNCTVQISEGQAVLVESQVLCHSCASTLNDTLEGRTKNPNYAKASAFGVVAGVVGAFVWFLIVAFLHIQFGLLAVGVGWLVGVAVVVGAGGKIGGRLQIVSVVVTLLALMVSEYEIVRHTLSDEGLNILPLFPTPQLLLDIDMTSIKSDPMTLLFWAIALFQAFTIPAKR